jgi:hypothetical protein
MKVLIVVLALSLPGAALANGLSQAQQTVANELPLYGFKDVDVTTLSTAQLSHIQLILFSHRSSAQIRGNIGAVLGNSMLNTVFGRDVRG